MSRRQTTPLTSAQRRADMQSREQHTRNSEAASRRQRSTRRCWEQRVELAEDDIELGNKLWIAYQAGNQRLLAELAERPTRAFPYLREVTAAEREKATRPLSAIFESNLL